MSITRTLSSFRMVALAGVMTAAFSTSAAAQSKPIQLSLVTPIQIVPEDQAVGGFRFNLIYGRNSAMTGLDVGLVNHTRPGGVEGVQFGIVGITEGDFTGWQANWVNLTSGARGSNPACTIRWRAARDCSGAR